MKYFFTGLLLFSLASFGTQNSYSFVKDFTLKNVKVEGSTAYVTVEHQETYAPPRFEFVPGQICLESFPPQCHGTVVRLDDQIRGTETVETTFEVGLEEIYVYGSPVIITVIGPETEIVVRY